jgi:predicted RNA-binding protein YlqC (UPF0109 family)
MDSSTALREFLEYIIGQLIEQPEEGAIAHELSDDGKHHKFVVTLTEDDVGHIIGRNGHTVSAIRSLLEAAADRDGQSVSLKVVGPEEGADDPVEVADDPAEVADDSASE